MPNSADHKLMYVAGPKSAEMPRNEEAQAQTMMICFFSSWPLQRVVGVGRGYQVECLSVMRLLAFLGLDI
jgi:hypothetical protein